MYKIAYIAIEDIAAKTIKKARKWNINFSPIEVGKNWFYESLRSLGYKIFKYKGYDTSQMRIDYGLKKNSQKNKKCFYTHCVDSWCLATEVIGGLLKPEHTFVKFLKPLRYYRRKLHEILPKKDNFRRLYGGTLSLGIKRGTLVKHLKFGLALIGGTSNNKLSLHYLITNKRFCRNTKIEDLKILTNLKWLVA